jgi:hypothetical protein
MDKGAGGRTFGSFAVFDDANASHRRLHKVGFGANHTLRVCVLGWLLPGVADGPESSCVCVCVFVGVMMMMR